MNTYAKQGKLSVETQPYSVDNSLTIKGIKNHLGEDIFTQLQEMGYAYGLQLEPFDPTQKNQSNLFRLDFFTSETEIPIKQFMTKIDWQSLTNDGKTRVSIIEKTGIALTDGYEAYQDRLHVIAFLRMPKNRESTVVKTRSPISDMP